MSDPRYEDVLEAMDPDELDALLPEPREKPSLHDGDDVLVSVTVGDLYDLMHAVLEAERTEEGSGEAVWDAALEAVTDQVEAAQLLARVALLERLAGFMAGGALEKAKVLHRETCEKCRERHEQRLQLEGDVLQALQALLDAAERVTRNDPEEDDEPWRADA